MAGAPDWKPAPPHREKGALARIHREQAVSSSCAICGVSRGLSLHHVFDRGDVRENLVFLCGSGTTGCHGAVTVNDVEALRALGEHVRRERHDVIRYVFGRVGEAAGQHWFLRRLHLYLSERDVREIGGADGTRTQDAGARDG